jgi:hypothetical protein
LYHCDAPAQPDDGQVVGCLRMRFRVQGTLARALSLTLKGRQARSLPGAPARVAQTATRALQAPGLCFWAWD